MPSPHIRPRARESTPRTQGCYVEYGGLKIGACGIQPRHARLALTNQSRGDLSSRNKASGKSS